MDSPPRRCWGDMCKMVKIWQPENVPFGREDSELGIPLFKSPVALLRFTLLVTNIPPQKSLVR